MDMTRLYEDWLHEMEQAGALGIVRHVTNQNDISSYKNVVAQDTTAPVQRGGGFVGFTAAPKTRYDEHAAIDTTSERNTGPGPANCPKRLPSVFVGPGPKKRPYWME